ncbi:MAG: hypothetical protein UT39_C0022G0011 [Candidatus Woesebacteria bacterium GW2011_GWA1_39_21]|uniref:Uncharacterized protein n=1 Tax=Candidatus Woesebacteria bacterium GW2011_GWA1_39_21 TaxID=1618550 RepID=A0A0G0R8Z1_9BACT|nr:MAG: hypothetical protein UT39_C0022G0011 [Candidatus Woesebacteria bacterium GW2011_GWA1_39_21]
MKRYVVIALILLAAILLSFLFIFSRSNKNPASLVSLGTPLQASPNFKYKIKGANSTKLLFKYRYENSYYNYEYEVDLANQTSGKISVATGPERENIEIQITAVSESGKMSEPLVFKTSEWWKRLKYNFIGHTFVIQKS